MDKNLFFYELEGRGYIFQNKKWEEAKHGFEDDMLNMAWEMWSSAKHSVKAQAVPEGFGLFDGDTLTYSNGYSINCSFDDEFDCHIFDVYQNEDCVKDGMTQLEQAHCLVLSMIKLDAKDSMIEAQEPTND